jgi:hypothetical protein
MNAEAGTCGGFKTMQLLSGLTINVFVMLLCF